MVIFNKTMIDVPLFKLTDLFTQRPYKSRNRGPSHSSVTCTIALSIGTNGNRQTRIMDPNSANFDKIRAIKRDPSADLKNPKVVPLETPGFVQKPL
jgi:hypothetical protein